MLVPGRKILANKTPVVRPSEAFDQESAGHNWLLTSRSKILKSGGSIEFFVDFHSLYRDALDYILRKVEEISRDSARKLDGLIVKKGIFFKKRSILWRFENDLGTSC